MAVVDAEIPRIALYGVGVYGKAFVRLANRKGWKIVAAYNRAGDKVGQDLGRLAELDHDLGVIVQDCDTASYDLLDADIGIVSVSDRLAVNWPAYERLMGAGLNVICHGGESNYPQGNDPQLAVRLQHLAVKNGVTFTGTSIWDYSRIWSGILAAGPCTAVSSIRHSSLTDVNWDRPEIVDVIGLGYSPQRYQQTFADSTHGIGGFYPGIIQHVLTKLGLTVVSINERREPALLNQPVYCKALKRQLEKGESVGSRIIAELETEQGVSASTRIDLRLLLPGEVEHMRWDVEGEPGTSVIVERKDSQLASAACLLNRIPDVIAADPGIRLISDLGPMSPSF